MFVNSINLLGFVKQGAKPSSTFINDVLSNALVDVADAISTIKIHVNSGTSTLALLPPGFT